MERCEIAAAVASFGGEVGRAGAFRIRRRQSLIKTGKAAARAQPCRHRAHQMEGKRTRPRRRTAGVGRADGDAGAPRGIAVRRAAPWGGRSRHVARRCHACQGDKLATVPSRRADGRAVRKSDRRCGRRSDNPATGRHIVWARPEIRVSDMIHYTGGMVHCHLRPPTNVAGARKSRVRHSGTKAAMLTRTLPRDRAKAQRDESNQHSETAATVIRNTRILLETRTSRYVTARPSSKQHGQG